MSIVENFNELSETALLAFAEDLINKLNASDAFKTEITLQTYELQTSELTGDLTIFAIPEGDERVEVAVPAEWSCSTEDDLDDIPDEYNLDTFDLNSSAEEAAKELFKESSVVIDGYKIDLIVNEVEREKIVDTIVENHYDDDSGIGSYEYFGATGYDSHPFVAIEGKLVYECRLLIELTVSPLN
jgi:hypothetical protein